MSKKDKLYTAAGIRVILQKINLILSHLETSGPDFGERLFHVSNTCDYLHEWKAELEKELRTKEQWAEFYKNMREQNEANNASSR